MDYDDALMPSRCLGMFGSHVYMCSFVHNTNVRNK